MKKIIFALLTAGLTSLSAPGFAVTLAQVNVADDIYGPFSGSIDSNATGFAATLNWDSAVYGAFFTIDFTNAAGITTDVLFSGSGVGLADYFGDELEFDGFNSGNNAIGMPCIAAATTACLPTTGSFQDVTGLITSLNGEGICCGGSDISVLANDATVPEPASLTILGTALVGAHFSRRRRSV